MLIRCTKIVLALITLLYGSLSSSAWADHGPTSSSGAFTQTGHTLEEGQFVLDLNVDLTFFEELGNNAVARRTGKVDDDHPHFEALDWSVVQMFELTYGIFDSFQIGAAIGFYRGDDFREGEIHHGDEHGDEVEIDQFGDIQGVTDLWVTGKWEAVKGPWGRLAPYVGIKLPTGRDDLRGHSNDHALEPSVQPGTGAFDFLFGSGYTFPVNARLDLHGSGQYILRTEADRFKVGDRIDGGIAAVFRLVDDIDRFPRVSLVGEVTVRHVFKEEDDGNVVTNSGGTVLFLSPGVQLGLNKRVSFFVIPQVPVMQALNDEQQKILVKVFTGLSITFGGERSKHEDGHES